MRPLLSDSQKKCSNKTLISASHSVDLFNSGRKDLVFGTAGGQRSSKENGLVFLNLGDGLFQYRDDLLPAKYAKKEGHTTSIASGDFSGNGFQDLLIVSARMNANPSLGYERSQVNLYLNRGNGQFTDATARVKPSAFKQWPEWIRVADFDRDGKLDFLLTSSGCPEPPCLGGKIYLNLGDSRFEPQSINMNDFYGTYRDNRLWYDRAQNFRRDGVRSRVDSIDLLVGDLNQDGMVDIFSPGLAYSWATFINKSTPGNLEFDIRFSGGTEFDCRHLGSLFIPFCVDKLFNIFPSLDRGRNYCQKTHHPRLCDEVKRSVYPFWHKHQLLKNGVLIDVNDNGFLDAVFTKSQASKNQKDASVNLLLNDLKGGYYFKQSLNTDLSFVRQMRVGQFSEKTKKQIFFADHGPDSHPFNGGKNMIVGIHHKKDGAPFLKLDYKSKELTYTHGASVDDFSSAGTDQIFKNEHIDFSLLENKKIYRTQDLFYSFNRAEAQLGSLSGGGLFKLTKKGCKY